MKRMRSIVWGLQIALLIGVLTSCSGFSYTREEDWLLPYLKSHENPKRNLRHVRDCQHIIHGNRTHESHIGNKSSEKTVVESFSYLSHTFSYRRGAFGKTTKLVHGHIAVVNNPLKTISVLYPEDAVTCSKLSGLRQTVSHTARNSKCTLAINAGFFNTHTAGCLGNIISNGKLIHNSNGIQNANFGIRSDGTMVVGYLSEDDVLEKDNPFVQLVSGVGWLIRDGRIYTNESKKAECADTEETGTIDRFFNVVSARSAIGHDKEGRVFIVTIDGKTDKEGVNLEELAQILKEHGAVNAINLDGGGSATFVVNGTVVNYPSDACGKDYSCERKVSTIVCVKDHLCDGCKCLEGNGNCIHGICKCRSTQGDKQTSNNSTVVDGRMLEAKHGHKKDATSIDKKEITTESRLHNQNNGSIWFLSITAVLACSLLMNIFLVVALRVSKKRKEKPWRQGDLRGLLDDDSDGI